MRREGCPRCHLFSCTVTCPGPKQHDEQQQGTAFLPHASSTSLKLMASETLSAHWSHMLVCHLDRHRLSTGRLRLAVLPPPRVHYAQMLVVVSRGSATESA